MTEPTVADRRMLESLRVWPLLNGYRGRARADDLWRGSHLGHSASSCA